MSLLTIVIIFDFFRLRLFVDPVFPLTTLSRYYIFRFYKVGGKKLPLKARVKSEEPILGLAQSNRARAPLAPRRLAVSSLLYMKAAIRVIEHRHMFDDLNPNCRQDFSSLYLLASVFIPLIKLTKGRSLRYTLWGACLRLAMIYRSA